MARIVSRLPRLQRGRSLPMAVAIGALAALIPGAAAQASPVGECQAVAANQAVVTQCLQTTLSSADQVMGMALDRLLKRADELDTVTGRPVARPAVEQAQVEWQAFRDANCAVPAALSGGASGSGQFQLGCMITMSRARANELDEFAAGIY